MNHGAFPPPALEAVIESGAPARCRHVAEAILSRTRADAVGLMGISPQDGSHISMLDLNYAPAVTEHHVSARYTQRIPEMKQLLSRPGVPHTWDDFKGFRESFEAQNVYRPAGYRNGMSMTLATARGEAVGVLHVSTRDDRVDPETKNMVDQIEPHLSAWVCAMMRFQLARLSVRETEILTLVRDGLSNSQIAGELYLSLRTVTTHVERILHKLGATNRTEAAVLAERYGLRALA